MPRTLADAGEMRTPVTGPTLVSAFATDHRYPMNFGLGAAPRTATVLIVRIGLLTREYPPDVYGGAGVHVEYLVPRAPRAHRRRRALLRRDRARHRPTRTPVPAGLAGANAALQTLGVDLSMVDALGDADLAALAHLVREHGRAPGKLLYGVPHVRHGALAGAAPAVEGRAARRRLPALVVGRAHRLRGAPTPSSR